MYGNGALIIECTRKFAVTALVKVRMQQHKMLFTLYAPQRSDVACFDHCCRYARSASLNFVCRVVSVMQTGPHKGSFARDNAAHTLMDAAAVRFKFGPTL